MLEDCPGANIFLSRLSHIALFRTPFFFWLFQNPKTNAKTELSRPRLTFWGLWQFLTSGQFSTQEVNPTSTACSLPFRPASKPTATGGVSFGSWTNSPPGQPFGGQSTPAWPASAGYVPPFANTADQDEDGMRHHVRVAVLGCQSLLATSGGPMGLNVPRAANTAPFRFHVSR